MAKKIISYGEVLWDNLPSGAVPGGAPMNVAIRAQSFGISATIISRIGNDKAGAAIRKYIRDKQVDTSLLQTDPSLPTGTVDVKLDAKGVATYDIKRPVAWDEIALTDEAIEQVKRADAFIFGSLSCRNETSKLTLLKLADCARFKVFDVNLRSTTNDLTLIEKLFKTADLVKLNDEELLILAKEFGSPTDDLKENILFLYETFEIKTICITRGEHGALLFTANNFYANNGIKVNVVDTVGAGDSFLAALIVKLLNNTDYSQSIDFACAVGSLVATKTGANALITDTEINQMIQNSTIA